MGTGSHTRRGVGLNIQLKTIEIPGGLFDVDIARVIENALSAEAKNVKVDFDVTTQTWSKRPTFQIKKKNAYTFQVFTNSEIYGYVNFGTKPHIIRPKNARVLAFSGGGYKPKTVARRIASFAGGSSGAPAFAREVRHPGTTAREFDDEIVKKWNQLLPRIFERAILFEITR